MKQNQSYEPSAQSEIILKITLDELKARFPGITMLNIHQTAEALGLPGAQSVYNALRKNAPYPFPIKAKKTCGKLYWSIVKIAEYLSA